MDSEHDKAVKAGGKNESHHHSLLDDIMGDIQKLDSEFPLSGGETEDDFENVDDKEAAESEKEKHPKTSFMEDLDTEFPLSGGETDR